MNIRILQCYHKGFAPLSKLIRWHQRTNYSHYAIGYRSITGNYVFVDATSKNVSPYSPENFLKKYHVVNVFHVELDVSEIENLSLLESYYGTPYSVMQLLGLLFSTKRWNNAANAMTCNELILRYLNHFTNKNIQDIDSLDLNDTERIIKEIIDDSNQTNI